MAQKYLILAGIAAVVLPAALIWDKRRWRSKPSEEFIRMAETGNHAEMLAGLQELKKRGHDINGFRTKVLKMLLASSVVDRVTAKMAIESCYPEDKILLGKYEGSASLEQCREGVKPLYEKYQLSVDVVK